MGAKNDGMPETKELIKQAIYDLQVGPSEIVFSPKRPTMYCVKFDSRSGAAIEVDVPVSSTYATIYDALKSAYYK